MIRMSMIGVGTVILVLLGSLVIGILMVTMGEGLRLMVVVMEY